MENNTVVHCFVYITHMTTLTLGKCEVSRNSVVLGLCSSDQGLCLYTLHLLEMVLCHLGWAGSAYEGIAYERGLLCQECL